METQIIEKEIGTYKIEVETEINVIHYGFGKEYLKTWGVQEALREIYQNFLDYGPYDEFSDEPEESDLCYVSISNNWKPENLEFLRIGNSRKGSGVNNIGKHGEGLKMAFLILLREGHISVIYTPKYYVYPMFYFDKEIGECFSLVYKEHNIEDHAFKIMFQIPTSEYKTFKNNLILKSDIIFSDNHWGDIVSKTKGNIYSGGLFVCNKNNISKAYNIKPEHLPLDRDRQVPQSFDLSYAASKINDKYGKWETKDLTCSDTAYLDNIPQEMKKQFRPKLVGNDIQFIHKNEQGKDVVVSNSNLKQALINDSFFFKIISKIKMFLAKKLGLYDLLVEFKEKHVHNAEAIADFEVILERVTK